MVRQSLLERKIIIPIKCLCIHLWISKYTFISPFISSRLLIFLALENLFLILKILREKNNIRENVEKKKVHRVLKWIFFLYRIKKRFFRRMKIQISILASLMRVCHVLSKKKKNVLQFKIERKTRSTISSEKKIV